MGSGKSRQYSTMAEEYAAEKERLIAGCNFCGDCLEVCPVFPYRSDQKQGTVEVQEEIVRVLEGHDGTNVAKEQAFSCSSCGMCITSCPQGLNPFRLREILKAELVRCGYHPPSAIAQPKIGGKIYDLPQVIGSLQIKPSQVRWLTGTPRHPQPRETVIFLGCNVLQMPDKMIALLGLLDSTGLDYAALAGGDICCGSKFLQRGELAKAEKVTGDFIQALASFQPRRVFFWCGTCDHLTRHEFPKYTDIPFEALHVSRLLVELLPRLKLNTPVEAKVTYQDPCNLGRKDGEYESVRTLLRAIPGLNLVEMAHNRENALCCGGAAQRYYPNIAGAMRRKALDEAQDTGAQLLANACQGCHRFFSVIGEDYPFQIKNYITLLAEAAGHSQEDGLQHYLKLGSLDAILDEAKEFVEAGPYTEAEYRHLLPLYFGPSFARSTAGS